MMADADDAGPFYRSLGIGSQDVPDPTWELVQHSMLTSERVRDVGISLHSGDEETFLLVYYVEPVGYLVHGLGLGEKDFFILYDPVLSEEKIEFWDGGNTTSLPRFTFVAEELMLSAMKFFYETGSRDPTLHWWDEFELAHLWRDE